MSVAPIAFYNEIDPFAASWLESLISDGLICPGIVDRRDIRDIAPSELSGFVQCHFFAGIGGWSLGLRQAGWPDDKPVWTGSCPCQPFSAAGKGNGFADERHLWPAFHHLISQSKPPIVFGEQVASKAALDWIDLVRSDMEGAGYALGVADLCAASVGAPHIRQRLWWVGKRLDYAASARCFWPVEDTKEYPRDEARLRVFSEGSTLDQLGNAYSAGSPTRHEAAPASRHGHSIVSTGKRPWTDFELLECLDGKCRPTQSGILPLAHGISGRMVIRRTVRKGESEIQEEHWYSRVGALKGAGNAIVPQVAAEFIKASV